MTSGTQVQIRKNGPRSGYGFLRTACQPIRLENFEKRYYNNISYLRLEDEWKKDDDYYDISDEYPDAGKIDKETKLRMTIESLIGGEPPEHLSLLGHQQFDLIRNCTWKGVDCNTG
jgi:hypothetical protein